MILGDFYFSHGIYELNGRFYKPRWYANPFKMTIAECKNILETAYDANGEKSAKGILIVDQIKWNEIAGSYNSWTGLAKFHYYDSFVNAGVVPQWMSEANGYNNAFIHEYADGKIAYLGREDLIYKFFVDSPAPAIDIPDKPQPPTDNPIAPPTVSAKKWHVTGRLGWLGTIDITAEVE